MNPLNGRRISCRLAKRIRTANRAEGEKESKLRGRARRWRTRSMGRKAVAIIAVPLCRGHTHAQTVWIRWRPRQWRWCGWENQNDCHQGAREWVESGAMQKDISLNLSLDQLCRQWSVQCKRCTVKTVNIVKYKALYLISTTGQTTTELVEFRLLHYESSS